MNTYLFIDNQYENELYFMIQGDGSLESIKENFKKEYYKLIDEYWYDNMDSWKYNDFYDELNDRLEKYGISIYEPEIIDHNGIMHERND